MPTFSLDLSALTVIATDADGEDHDLNAGGTPCETRAELANLVRQLEEVGAFSATVRDQLLVEMA